mgnify:CR=1 FL=1
MATSPYSADASARLHSRRAFLSIMGGLALTVPVVASAPSLPPSIPADLRALFEQICAYAEAAPDGMVAAMHFTRNKDMLVSSDQIASLEASGWVIFDKAFTRRLRAQLATGLMPVGAA